MLNFCVTFKLKIFSIFVVKLRTMVQLFLEAVSPMFTCLFQTPLLINVLISHKPTKISNPRVNRRQVHYVDIYWHILFQLYLFYAKLFFPHFIHSWPWVMVNKCFNYETEIYYVFELSEWQKQIVLKLRLRWERRSASCNKFHYFELLCTWHQSCWLSSFVCCIKNSEEF